ncbi:MAG: thiamine pyrophosphate-binding protein [Albidovulum sp.]|nr:thiamine pyrophosphate-binding protein [Albidovulum sp.]MDE0530416.1 thiamine pyrophosphate-binding protein [Albidovulum sp.]
MTGSHREQSTPSGPIGADALVSGLLANAIDTVFSVPGGQLDDFFDAAHRSGGKFRILRARHEQGAAYMAFGAARSTGRPSAFAVVPGPGLMNAMAALSTAWAVNAPVLCLSGQIPSEAIGSGRGYLHEIPDQLATVRTLIKYAERIDAPEKAAGMINSALTAMRTGRPGPAHLETPPDIMRSKLAAAPMPRAAELPDAPCAEQADIEKAVALLRVSKRPLIYVGGGATGAAAEVNRLARLIEAPVTCFRSGRGIVDDRDYRAQVFPAGRRLWKNADVVFAIGTRLKYPQLYWGVDDKIKIIRLDIDDREFNRYPAPAAALRGDSTATLRKLLPILRDEIKTPPASRKAELSGLKEGLRAEMKSNLRPQMEYLEAIRDVLPDEGFFCDEITQIGFVSWYGFPIHRLRGHVNCGFQGTLGYGFATALGVKAANPSAPVVSISGDGGFLYTATELAAAVEYGINLVAIVFNDNRYANVYRQQKEWFGGRFIASDLRNPDFVKFAESFGANADKASGPNELRLALERAFAARMPTIIEAHQPRDLPTPWRYILESPVRGHSIPVVTAPS